MGTYRFAGSVAALALLAGCGQDNGSAVSTTATADLMHTLASYTLAPETTSSIGCQSRSTRWPWGQGDLRTWTPRLATTPRNPFTVAGSAYGQPFAARLVQAYSYDFGDTHRRVVLETEDGCRRAYWSSSFSDDDNAIIDAAVAQHPVAEDPNTYRIKYSDPDPNGHPLTSPELVASGELNLYQTQHFAFWYGNGTTDDYKFPWFNRWVYNRTMEQAVKDTADWYERVWTMYRDVLGAPMPFANSDDKQKLNIYLCGTGRPNAGGDKDDCGASAGAEQGVSAWAVPKGSKVAAHEFGHMVQYHSGGFRDNWQAGPIWETGAEWGGYTLAGRSEFLEFYLNNLESGPLFSVSRYGAFPFMSYLFENDRTRSLVYDVWKPIVSKTQGGWEAGDKDAALRKDFVQAIVQRGGQTGAYPQGFNSFADDMGWYGARLAAMDFVDQSSLIDQTRANQNTSFLGHFYTPMVASGTDANTYAPPVERALLQYGTHLIPLTAAEGQKVTVTLTGGTKANAAAWRFAIVAVTNDYKPTYSMLGKATGLGSGTTTLTIPAGTRAYLAVTATPTRYESLGWQDVGSPIKGTRYPYTIKVEGATPRTGPVTACDVEMNRIYWTYNYTLNGNTDQSKPC